MNVPTPAWVAVDDFVECDRRCPICNADVYENTSGETINWRCANHAYGCPYDIETS